MTDDNRGRETSLHEQGIRVQRVRRARRKLPAATYAMRDEESGQEIGCIPVVRGSHASRRQVDTARQLWKLASEVLLVEEHAGLIDERTAARLDACADILGPAWVETFMQDVETAKRALYEARLSDIEDVAAQLQWASVTLQKLAVLHHDVPKWLSPELAVLLLGKFSFGRGGGTDGAMSSEGMRGRLRNPDEMAKWLRGRAGRSSRFSDELRALDEVCEQAPKRRPLRRSRTVELVDARRFGGRSKRR